MGKKTQVQTIIFRLCRELDDKDNSINECMKDIAEQRRRAESLQVKLREQTK